MPQDYQLRHKWRVALLSNRIQGCPLLLNECDVMRDVFRDSFQQSLHGHGAILTMNRRPLPALKFLMLQNTSHVSSDRRNQIKFVVDFTASAQLPGDGLIR